MSTPRTSLGHTLLLGAVAALTTWATLLTWSDFAVDYGEYLGPLLSLSLLLGIGGGALRWLRVPVAVVPLVQLLAAGWVMMTTYGGHGPLPTPAALGGLRDALAMASDTASQYASPVPFDAPSVAPLLVGCGVLAIVAVDVIACGLGRVPVSGLALLLVYTLPVTIWGSSIPWWTFVLTAAGFLLMLYLREDERFAQWGHRLSANPGATNLLGYGTQSSAVRSSAVALGAVATTAALVLPVAIPTFGVRLFDGGAGFGRGGDQVTIVNPMTDLRRDLRQGADIPLLEVTTDQDDPSYLRYTVLTTFTGNEWTPGDRSIPSEQVARGQLLPDPVGVSAQVPRENYNATYRTYPGFRSRWLPVPAPAYEVTAPGVWKFDTTTMDFISGDDSLTDDMSYTATGVQLNVDAAELTTATEPDEALLDRFTALPRVPEIVTDLATEVTRGTTTDFQKALALQDFFRSSGTFTYTLDAPRGNGNQNLATFLSPTGPESRRGYCEQFASAMAVMARSLGIPARVAVGFLRPEQVTRDSYVYSSHDLHAWPELYFQGAGWIRFEPTPPGRSGTTAPSYTVDRGADQDPSAAPSTDDTTSAQPTQQARPTAKPAVGPEESTAATTTDGFPWIRALVALVLLVLLAVALVVPRAVRRSRRERRFRTGTAESAWAELQDAAVDLGMPWPSGRSPRATAETVSGHLAAPGDIPRPLRGPRADPEGYDALGRLMSAIEVERYAGRPEPADPASLQADVETCAASLRRGVPDRVKRRADWLPASVVGPLLGAGGRRHTTNRDQMDAEPETTESLSGQSEELEGADR